MKLILLSGGSGKRLWPLSNETRSKQFLKVLKSDNGENVSMVQRVWSQLENVGLTNHSIIATSKTQKEILNNQLGLNIPIITEPERRDTFPAIALASSYLYSNQKIDTNEVVVVLPVDPYVEDNFFYKVKQLEKVVLETSAEIALMGVKPTFPSSKYGYIVPKAKTNGIFEVDRFTEKPTEAYAESLIKERALWNCGVFAFRLGYILDLLKQKELPVEYYSLKRQYTLLPKISFDYEVVEKAKRVVALPYNGYWKDLGTWNTLTEEMVTNQIGKGVISGDSVNTHLINELDIPITVIGMKNLVVAASPDGILVSDKSSSPKIKDLIQEFDTLPMYEERLWGWSRILDYSKYEDGQEMVTKRILIKKGMNLSYHYHKLRDEVWTIVKGEGDLVIDHHITRVKAGDVVQLTAGKKHAVRAISELEFIEVQTAFEVTEEDIYRLTNNWEEVIKLFQQSKSVFIN